MFAFCKHGLVSTEAPKCIAGYEGIKNEILNSNFVFVKGGGHMLLYPLCASSHLTDDLGCLFVVLPCTGLLGLLIPMASYSPPASGDLSQSLWELLFSKLRPSSALPSFFLTKLPSASLTHAAFLLSLQKQAMLVRQLEEEVVKTRQQAKETNPEIKAHIEALQIENDHLTREIAILKETIRVSWEQITQPLNRIFVGMISFQHGTDL